LAFFLALGLAGSGDVKEQEKIAEVYTEMVCKGHWPDYENRKPVCKKS
jgi:hypothetical protein